MLALWTNSFVLILLQTILRLLLLSSKRGSDGVFLEHVLYAGKALVYPLVDLFNLCTIHGFVPVSFISSSVIVPVLKDKTELMLVGLSAVIINLRSWTL